MPTETTVLKTKGPRESFMRLIRGLARLAFVGLPPAQAKARMASKWIEVQKAAILKKIKLEKFNQGENLKTEEVKLNTLIRLEAAYKKRTEDLEKNIYIRYDYILRGELEAAGFLEMSALGNQYAIIFERQLHLLNKYKAKELAPFYTFIYNHAQAVSNTIKLEVFLYNAVETNKSIVAAVEANLRLVKSIDKEGLSDEALGLIEQLEADLTDSLSFGRDLNKLIAKESQENNQRISTLNNHEKQLYPALKKAGFDMGRFAKDKRNTYRGLTEEKEGSVENIKELKANFAKAKPKLPRISDEIVAGTGTILKGQAQSIENMEEIQGIQKQWRVINSRRAAIITEAKLNPDKIVYEEQEIATLRVEERILIERASALIRGEIMAPAEKVKAKEGVRLKEVQHDNVKKPAITPSYESKTTPSKGTAPEGGKKPKPTTPNSNKPKP